MKPGSPPHPGIIARPRVRKRCWHMSGKFLGTELHRAARPSPVASRSAGRGKREGTRPRQRGNASQRRSPESIHWRYRGASSVGCLRGGPRLWLPIKSAPLRRRTLLETSTAHHAWLDVPMRYDKPPQGRNVIKTPHSSPDVFEPAPANLARSYWPSSTVTRDIRGCPTGTPHRTPTPD